MCRQAAQYPALQEYPCIYKLESMAASKKALTKIKNFLCSTAYWSISSLVQTSALNLDAKQFLTTNFMRYLRIFLIFYSSKLSMSFIMLYYVIMISAYPAHSAHSRTSSSRELRHIFMLHGLEADAAHTTVQLSSCTCSALSLPPET